MEHEHERSQEIPSVECWTLFFVHFILPPLLRLSVSHWQLIPVGLLFFQIRYPQKRDTGVYECQISTTPPVGHSMFLAVVGKCPAALNSRSRYWFNTRLGYVLLVHSLSKAFECFVFLGYRYISILTDTCFLLSTIPYYSISICRANHHDRWCAGSVHQHGLNCKFNLHSAELARASFNHILDP